LFRHSHERQMPTGQATPHLSSAVFYERLMRRADAATHLLPRHKMLLTPRRVRRFRFS